MKAKEIFSKKIPVLFATVCCFAVVTLSAVAKQQNHAAEVSAAASRQQVIVLDAGHGGLDSGCVAVNGAYEKDINLSIVKYLGEMLSFSGYKVIYTRSEDRSIHDDGIEGIRNQKISDMENRLKIVNQYPDSVFLSVHQNLYTESEYFGAQMFYTTNNSGNFRLASIMQELFAELQPNNDRSAKLIDNGLYLFKETKQPALLIECGFLSNPSDAANLSSSEYQKKVAFTICRGLTQYLEEAVIKEEKEPVANESILYMQEKI